MPLLSGGGKGEYYVVEMGHPETQRLKNPDIAPQELTGFQTNEQTLS